MTKAQESAVKLMLECADKVIEAHDLGQKDINNEISDLASATSEIERVFKLEKK